MRRQQVQELHLRLGRSSLPYRPQHSGAEFNQPRPSGHNLNYNSSAGSFRFRPWAPRKTWPQQPHLGRAVTSLGQKQTHFCCCPSYNSSQSLSFATQVTLLPLSMDEQLLPKLLLHPWRLSQGEEGASLLPLGAHRQGCTQRSSSTELPEHRDQRQRLLQNNLLSFGFKNLISGLAKLPGTHKKPPKEA